MSIRQGAPPDYFEATNNVVLPVIPNSNKIYPTIAPLPSNHQDNYYPTDNNLNLGFRPLPQLVVPSQTNLQNTRAKKKTISKLVIFAYLVAAVLICVGIAVAIYYIYIAIVGSSAICKDGYSILDCSLECGILKNPTSYHRIVGGSEVRPHSWPAQALVIFSFSGIVQVGGFNYNVNKSSMCGGTLIGKSSVLTAAHCVLTSFQFTSAGTKYTYNFNSDDKIEKYYTVYLGAHNIDSFNEPSLVRVQINRITKHSSYNEYNNLNDIAVFNLKTEVSLNDKIQVACVPNSLSTSYPSSESNTKVAYGVGWGTTSEGGNTASELQEVDLLIYESSFCSGIASSYQKDFNSQICAGYLPGGKDTCQGDSGGPLYIYTTVGGKQKYVAVGITSYGVGCADPNRPAIYTRNSNYYDWIRKNKASSLRKINLCVIFFCIILSFVYRLI